MLSSDEFNSILYPIKKEEIFYQIKLPIRETYDINIHSFRKSLKICVEQLVNPIDAVFILNEFSFNNNKINLNDILKELYKND